MQQYWSIINASLTTGQYSQSMQRMEVSILYHRSVFSEYAMYGDSIRSVFSTTGQYSQSMQSMEIASGQYSLSQTESLMSLY